MEWPPILVLVSFFLTNFLVIFPLQIRIPRRIFSAIAAVLVNCRIIEPSLRISRNRYIPVDFRTVPLVSVLTLLATGAVSGSDVRSGIVGIDGIKPISIMALFMSLAYISISLDATGLLRFLAFWAARKGGSSGKKLYLYLYMFFLLCGVVVGNDPVILSGTAFLAYLTRVSGIVPPTAWIFAQFAAANMASAVLVSSNPTNLVLSGAFGLSFTTYTAHLILPFLAAALTVYPVLTLILFRSPELIPASLDLDSSVSAELASSLVDPHGAFFGGGLLVVTLGVLVGTSIIGVPVWQVTVPPAVIMLIRDALHDYSHRSKILVTGNHDLDAPVELRGRSRAGQISAPTRHAFSTVLSRNLFTLYKNFPTVTAISRRLPVSLLPFAFLMFILVQSLSSKGWIEIFARWWAAWVHKTGLSGAVFGMIFISCLLCNVCGTNIGCTILLARVLQLWDAPSPRTRDGVIYALALGSNYGAFSLSFAASLAGLLWRDILHGKGIRVHPVQFAKLNIPIVCTALLASAAVLLGEVIIIHRSS